MFKYNNIADFLQNFPGTKVQALASLKTSLMLLIGTYPHKTLKNFEKISKQK